MLRLMPAKPTIYSFFSKPADSIHRLVLVFISMMKSFAFAGSEMRSFVSIRRSAEQVNFSAEAMKSSGLISRKESSFKANLQFSKNLSWNHRSYFSTIFLLVFLLSASSLWGQTATLFLQNTQTQSGTGTAVRDLSLMQGSASTLTSTGTTSGTFAERLAFTRDVSNLSGEISGNSFPVSLNVNAVSSGNLSARFRLQRINSSGAVQASTGYSAEFNTTGIKTATLSFPSTQTWASTDRIRLSIEVRLTSGSTSRTITVSTGNADSFLSYTLPPPGATITRTFTSNGTFTVPPCVTSLTVEAWGGGGAGGGVTGNVASGGGGKGGSYVRRENLPVSASQEYVLTVGLGGTGGTGAGGAGGVSSFVNSSLGVEVRAAGGNGGGAGSSNNSDGSGATGLSGSNLGFTGSFSYNGGNGATGSRSNNRGGGGGSSAGTGSNGNNGSNQTGGSAPTGGGAGGNGFTGTNNEGNGNSATQIGGGGGGAVTDDGSDYSGGSGANGQIRITYTLPDNPTITLTNSTATTCFSASAQNVTLAYSATTGCPDKYTIDFASGITDVVDADLSGSPITIALPAGLAAGSYNGTLTVTNSTYGFVSSNYSITVTVNPPTPATPGTITGTATQCPGITSQTYSIAAVTNATTYNWTVPTGWSITAGAGTTSITVTTGSASQNGNISVTAGNSCGTSTARTLAVSVSPGTPAQPEAIIGTATQCPGITSQTYSIAAVTNATTYNWTVPTGWSITSGAGTTSITVTTGSASQNGNISVTAGNSCGTSTARTLAVTVNPASVAGTVSANQTICSGQTPTNITLTGNTGTIQWQVSTDNNSFTNIPGATASPLTSAQMGALTATRFYRAVVTSGACSSVNSLAVTVTVNALPTVTTTASNSKTYTGVSNSTTVSATVSVGATIDWYDAPTGGNLLSSGSLTYAPTAVNVGTYTVYAQARNSTTGCVSLERTPATLTITKANSTITATGSTTFTYTGLPQGPGTSDKTGSTGAVTYSYSGTGYGPSATPPTNAGTYQVVATVAADANFNGASSSAFAFTILPASSTVTVKSGTTSSFTYTGSAQGPGVSNFDFTGSLGARSVVYTGVSPTSYNSATPPTNAGTYQVVATVAADANYNAATSVALPFTINKAALTITAEPKSKVYGSSDPTLTYQINLGSLVSGDVLSGSLARESGENVGTYAINQGTLANSNYTITFTGANLNITPALLTITADNKTKTYGAAIPTLTFTYTGLVNSNTAVTTLPAISTTATASSNADTYPITLSGGADPNYTITLVNGTLTVERAALTITADTKTKTYGAANPTLTFTYSGLVNSNTAVTTLPTISTTATVSSNAGSYPITLLGGADPNYTITLVNGTLTINPLAITVTADPQSKIYGAADPAFTYRITSGSLVGSDVLSGSLSRAAGQNVGTYAITIGSLANTNYTITLESADLSITPKTLIITPDSGQSKQEGAANPTLTYQASGWEFTDGVSLLTGALSRESGESEGTYAITQGTLAVSGSNYVISFTSGVSFVITGRPAVKLAFIASPSGTSTVAGQPFATQPVIQIQNDQGGIVTSATTPVTLSLSVGSGELRGTVTLNAVNGVATFTGLNIDLVGTDKVLLAEAEGLESATTAAFTITPAPASLFTKYAGDQQVTQAGTAVDIAPAVRITDIFGNPISGVSVSFTVTSGGGSILPTTVIPTNIDGVASLTSWILGTTAGQNTLTASTADILIAPTTFTALGSQDKIEIFNSSTTWTVPPGVTSIVVEGWGGGGGGGGSGAFFGTGRGGGGGGGAYAKATISVSPGQILNIIVGSGGIGGNNAIGENGGGSRVVRGGTELISANGGIGGQRGSAVFNTVNGTGGNGGSGAGSTPGVNGGNGTNNFGGSGGGSGGGNGGSAQSSGNGNNGNSPGGGGGGSVSSGVTSNQGGAGGPGKIIITSPQPVNQFRPAISGNWEDAATWEQQFSNGQFARIDTKPSANSTVIISKSGVAVQGAPETVTVTVSEDLNFTGSIIVTSEGELSVASGKNLSLTSGSSLTVANEGLLTLPADGLVLGAGNVSVNRGSTLSIAHPEGVKAIGTAGGAIQNTGSRSFNAEANYHYNGTSAQVIGNGLPAAVNSFIIDNPTKVTLDRPLEVALDLEVNNGVLELEETLTVDLGMELKGSSKVLVKEGKKFQADLLADLTTSGTDSRIVLEPGAKYLNLGISTPRLEVQQRLTGARGWRMLGAPVKGSQYSNFLGGLETQGIPGTAGSNLQPNVLLWDEKDGGTTAQGWRVPDDITQEVPEGKGHYVFVFDAAAKKLPATGTYNDKLPITLGAIGTEINLNNGGFDFGVTFTKRTQKFKGSATDGKYEEAGSADEGFNLIANPTASFIDFFASGWTKANIDQTIYVWDQNYNQVVEDEDGEIEIIQGGFRLITLETPPAERMLAPYQGFWVRTNAANPSLVMTNAVKADEFSAFYGRVLEEKPVTPASRIQLSISGEGLKAESAVRISQEGQDGLDPWDAFQLESLDNNWLNLYTLGSPKELTPLAINHLSLPTEGEKTVPLYLAAAKNGKPFSGTYTLDWEMPSNLPAGTRVVLMDHISKKAIDMSEVQSYTFSFEAPISTNARIRDEEGEMKQPQAVVFSHEIKDGVGENFRTAAGKVTRPFTLVIGYTGQGANPEYRPETAKLYTPSPNPFEEMTQVKFYLPISEEVEIKIYDMKGQEVGGFARKAYPSGINVLEWRPTAVHLPKGVYLIQMQTENMVMTQKAIKL